MELVAGGGNKGERRFTGKRERASSSSPLNLETFLVYGFSGECHAKTRYYALKAFPIFEQGTYGFASESKGSFSATTILGNIV